MQIQYFERFDPEMECIIILERRFHPSPETYHNIQEIGENLSKKYNIPQFELDTLLRPLQDVETYVNANLNCREDRLRFFFTTRTEEGSVSLALLPILRSLPRSGKLPESERFTALRRIFARLLSMQPEAMELITDLDQLIRYLLASKASEEMKWICTALFYSLDEHLEELDIILRKATALFLEHLHDTSDLCHTAIEAAKSRDEGDIQKLASTVVTALNIPIPKEDVTVIPCLMAFHGKRWDFSLGILYYGALYPQIADLVIKYSDQSSTLVGRLKSMGDKSRLEILRILKDRQYNGQEIAEALCLSPTTISHHTNVLCNDGFIQATKKGTSIYYELNRESVQNFLKALEHYLL